MTNKRIKFSSISRKTRIFLEKCWYRLLVDVVRSTHANLAHLDFLNKKSSSYFKLNNPFLTEASVNSMSTKFTKSRIRPNQIHAQLRCDMANWGDSHLMHLHCCHHYNNRQKTSVDIRQSFLILTSFPSSLDMSNKKIPFPKRRKRPGSSLLFYSNQYFIHKTVTKQCINLPFRRRHD